MLNYIRADYKRIAGRGNRVALMVIYMIALLAMLLIPWLRKPDEWNSVRFMDAMVTPVLHVYPVLMGLVCFVTTFADDFRCKTMQVAIGIGVSRNKVVISKLIQYALVVLTDLVAIGVVSAVIAVVSGANVTAAHTLKIFIDFLGAWLNCIGYASICMIIVFQLQGITVAMLVFLAFSSQLPYFLLRMLTRFGPQTFSRLHLEKLTLDYSLEVLRSNLIMGKLNFSAIMGVVIYIGIGLVCSCMIFRKRELDF